MPRDQRAILFDLDDTLYPLRDFVRSGFGAVSQHVERLYGVDRHSMLRSLSRASRVYRGRELQVAVARFGLPPDLVRDLVDIIRAHQPTLHLPADTAATLQSLRSSWRLAVVTNGFPDLQRRKVEALGLADLVDTVIYAAEHGSGRGKPDPEPFWAALTSVGLTPQCGVFVGDDERCDTFGAARVGLHAIQCAPAGPPMYPSPDAEAVVDRISDVPSVATRIIEQETLRHVA